MNNLIESLIDIAIKEDIGDGDHTSKACIPENNIGKAHLLIKQDGILAGVEIARYVFLKIDPKIKMDVFISDGAFIKKGDIAFIVEGSTQSLLQAERLVLNIMQRMSGIATQTNIYVEKIKGTKTKVLDTRKTTPGMRLLEKEAVKIGGGVNHRIGLYDMILIKDNHIDFAGGITQAITKTHEYLKNTGKKLKIEVEVRSIENIHEVLRIGGIDRVMFDNFTPQLTHEAVKLIDGKYETESSGGITLETIRDFAEAGVDFISVGALTHQIKSLDLSLKAI